jgi:hypothetical protein
MIADARQSLKLLANCHSREGGNPKAAIWTSAFAGVTSQDTWGDFASGFKVLWRNVGLRLEITPTTAKPTCVGCVLNRPRSGPVLLLLLPRSVQSPGLKLWRTPHDRQRGRRDPFVV